MNTCDFVNCSIKKDGNCIVDLHYKDCWNWKEAIAYHCKNCNNTFRDNSPPKCPYCGSYAIVTKPPEGEG